jgi:hypothetical protein
MPSGCTICRDPQQQPGHLQSISRAGAGILLPHAENTIFGNQKIRWAPRVKKSAAAASDWWQVNGWTAGVEVGVRYTGLQVHLPRTHAKVRLRRAA